MDRLLGVRVDERRKQIRIIAHGARAIAHVHAVGVPPGPSDLRVDVLLFILQYALTARLGDVKLCVLYDRAIYMRDDATILLDRQAMLVEIVIDRHAIAVVWYGATPAHKKSLPGYLTGAATVTIVDLTMGNGLAEARRQRRDEMKKINRGDTCAVIWRYNDKKSDWMIGSYVGKESTNVTGDRRSVHVVTSADGRKYSGDKVIHIDDAPEWMKDPFGPTPFDGVGIPNDHPITAC